MNYLGRHATTARTHRTIAALRAERLYGLVRESRGLNDVEIAVNLSEQRGQPCIVVENSRWATPHDHDHASGKFQHIAVMCPRQISQRKRLPVLAERGLDLPPDVAFPMRHGLLNDRPPRRCCRSRTISSVPLEAKPSQRTPDPSKPSTLRVFPTSLRPGHILVDEI